MRRLLILVLGWGLAVSASGSETTRTLRAELSGADARRFAVENLAGKMRISVGTGDQVAILARVFAESAELADAVSLERVADGNAPAALRVRYPYDRVKVFHYVDPEHDRDWPFGHMGSSSTFDYDGRRVRVNEGRGTRLWVDLEIQIPSGRREASFRNLVGRIEAEGLEGRIRFEAGSADLRLRRLDGETTIESVSGDFQASDLRGSLEFESSSGDGRLDDFDGSQLRFHTASGDLVARGVRAGRVEAETSSGDLSFASADVEDFEVDTASGDVTVDVGGARLQNFRVTTSSGDVSLGLPGDEAFDARADQSSGDMIVGFREGDEIRDDETLVGYRRGTGGARIRVSTSSGDFSIMPR
jgi:hypothetical protein